MADTSFYTILQYVGGGFAGWQRPPSDRTVQGVLEDGLKQLVGRRVVTHAAGRTDSGVHALGQVVSFEAPDHWSPDDLRRALNAVTPPDLWIADLGSAPAGFHARRHASARRYRFVIGCDPASVSPFRSPYEWALGEPIDSETVDRNLERCDPCAAAGKTDENDQCRREAADCGNHRADNSGTQQPSVIHGNTPWSMMRPAWA